MDLICAGAMAWTRSAEHAGARLPGGRAEVAGFLRWLLATLGGVMLGAGLFLHAEVALARYMRDEVDRTFVLWRAVGEATVLFQDDETRVAMVVAEVPDEALRASESTAWALVSIGLLVAVTAPMMRRRSSRKKG